MGAENSDALKPTEYHVVYTTEPDERWEVHYGDQKMGYQAWDKRVAISAAKEMATVNRPSKVVVHDREGAVQSEIPYDPK